MIVFNSLTSFAFAVSKTDVFRLFSPAKQSVFSQRENTVELFMCKSFSHEEFHCRTVVKFGLKLACRVVASIESINYTANHSDVFKI